MVAADPADALVHYIIFVVIQQNRRSFGCCRRSLRRQRQRRARRGEYFAKISCETKCKHPLRAAGRKWTTSGVTECLLQYAAKCEEDDNDARRFQSVVVGNSEKICLGKRKNGYPERLSLAVVAVVVYVWCSIVECLARNLCVESPRPILYFRLLNVALLSWANYSRRSFHSLGIGVVGVGVHGVAVFSSRRRFGIRLSVSREKKNAIFVQKSETDDWNSPRSQKNFQNNGASTETSTERVCSFSIQVR